MEQLVSSAVIQRTPVPEFCTPRTKPKAWKSGTLRADITDWTQRHCFHLKSQPIFLCGSSWRWRCASGEQVDIWGHFCHFMAHLSITDSTSINCVDLMAHLTICTIQCKHTRNLHFSWSRHFHFSCLLLCFSVFVFAQFLVSLPKMFSYYNYCSKRNVVNKIAIKDNENKGLERSVHACLWMCVYVEVPFQIANLWRCSARIIKSHRLWYNQHNETHSDLSRTKLLTIRSRWPRIYMVGRI